MNLKMIKQKSKEQIKPYVKNLSPVVLFNFYFHACLYVPYVIYKILAKGNPAVYSPKEKLLNIAYLLFCLFIYPVIHMAYLRLISRIANKKENEELKYIGIKGYISNFYLAGKAIGNYLWTMLWLSIWFFSLFIVLSKFIFFPILEHLRINQPLIIFTWILFIIFFIIIFGLFYYKIISYSMNTYAIADEEETEVIEAMKISKSLTKGHRGELFLLMLSFIPQYLLVVVTLGIAAVWIIPYYSMSYFNAYKELETEACRKISSGEAVLDTD
ncbi:MAG: DUF975 family protein [Treponema sp.]|nr:DUF975 family protein [Treponema sp.]